MIEAVIGGYSFRSAINLFIETHMFSNANEYHLIRAFEKVLLGSMMRINSYFLGNQQRHSLRLFNAPRVYAGSIQPAWLSHPFNIIHLLTTLAYEFNLEYPGVPL
jgi:hypothetical protein